MTDLAELQAEIVAERAARGFTTDPVRVLALLVEETGEVARELKKSWSPNYEDFSADRLAPELANVLVLVCALAAEHGIDLESSVRQKFLKDDAERPREGRALGGPVPPPPNAGPATAAVRLQMK